MVSAAAWPREVSRRRATDEGVAVGGAVAEDAAARGAGSTAAGNINGNHGRQTTFQIGGRKFSQIQRLHGRLPYDRIAKIDELGIAGSRLLSGFQQALELIGRPPIDMNSKLVDKIIVANETKRVKVYINSGCRKLNKSIQSLTNSKEILDELEGLLGDVTSAIQTTDGKLLAFSGLDFDVQLNEQATYNDLEEKDALSHSQSPDVTTTKKKKSAHVTDLAMVMAFIYSMVKQDYLMQEKIVSALDLRMSSEELESYCQMWSLRPFINDEIVHGAWQHIH